MRAPKYDAWGAIYKCYTQIVLENMKKLLVVIYALAVVSCATGPGQFANSMASDYGLKKYSSVDLENSEVKGKVAFIYTLLANTEELRVHQFNGTYDNEVYVKQEMVNGGYTEMVVKFERDADGNKIDGTGKLVRDCENMGSFNYKHPKREPLGHFAQDMLPWIKWGNCREDSTTLKQRISAYTADIELSLERLVAVDSPYYLPNDFDFRGNGQAETIAFFLKAFEISGFDLYGFINNGITAAESRKEFYKSLENGINALVEGKV